MNKICLTGAPPNTRNMGVTALAVSFVNIMKSIDPTIEVTFLLGARGPATQAIELKHSSYHAKLVNYRMSPKANFRDHILCILFLALAFRLIPLDALRSKILSFSPCLKEISESTFVASIHGGDSFSDIYGIGRFLSGIPLDIAALILGRPLVFLPQTYGPYTSLISRKLSTFLIKRATLVLSRDLANQRTISTVGPGKLDHYGIRFCPDVAYILHKNPTHSTVTQNEYDHTRIHPTIGINVNGLMYNGGYSRDGAFNLQLDYRTLVQDIIEKFLVETESQILMIPHNTAPRGDVESDLESSEKIIETLPSLFRERVHIVYDLTSPIEIKGFIAQCDFFIGSRMHACIAALSSGIPTIGIAYSYKFSGVFASVNAEQLVVDGRCLDNRAALSQVWQEFHRRKYWARVLEDELILVRQLIFDTFKGILNSTKTSALECDPTQ